mgnify:CR=1 FL=1
MARKIGKTTRRRRRDCLLAIPFEPPLVAGERETGNARVHVIDYINYVRINWLVATISRFGE